MKEFPMAVDGGILFLPPWSIIALCTVELPLSRQAKIFSMSHHFSSTRRYLELCSKISNPRVESKSCLKGILDLGLSEEKLARNS